MKIAILILVIAFALYIMIPAYPGRKMDVLCARGSTLIPFPACGPGRSEM
jgi:hypothetical protein